MEYVVILGFTAGLLTTFSYLPQVLKTLKTKSARDLSIHWLSIMTIGSVFWMIYGYFISSFPLIFFNMVLIVMTACLLVSKFKYG